MSLAVDELSVDEKSVDELSVDGLSPHRKKPLLEQNFSLIKVNFGQFFHG